MGVCCKSLGINFRTYYLHYHKNVDRYQYLEKFINNLLPGEVVTCFDKDTFDPNKYYEYNFNENFIAINSIVHILDYNIKLIDSFHSNNYQAVNEDICCPSKYDCQYIKKLTPERISLTNLSLNLKHRYVWQSIIKSNAEYGLVLEDDIIFTDNSIEKVLELINNKNIRFFDYIDLGGGCMLKPYGVNFKKVRDTSIYSLEIPTTRTTCAYLISRKMATQLIENKQKIMFPIDFQLTYCFNILQSKVGWADPEIFIHGSEHGYYNSSNPKK